MESNLDSYDSRRRRDPFARNLGEIRFFAFVWLGVIAFTEVLWPIAQRLYIDEPAEVRELIRTIDIGGSLVWILFLFVLSRQLLDVRFSNRGIHVGWFARRRFVPWSAIREIVWTPDAIELRTVERVVKLQPRLFRDSEAVVAELARRSPLASVRDERMNVSEGDAPLDDRHLVLSVAFGFLAGTLVLTCVVAAAWGTHLDVGLMLGGFAGLSAWWWLPRQPPWLAKAFEKPWPVVASSLFPISLLCYLALVDKPAELPGAWETCIGLILGLVATVLSIIGLLHLQIEPRPDTLPSNPTTPPGPSAETSR